MNSVIEAQEEYFDGKVLLMAPSIPTSMLIITNLSKKALDRDREAYFKRCRQYVAQQQQELWDKKIK